MSNSGATRYRIAPAVEKSAQVRPAQWVSLAKFLQSAALSSKINQRGKSFLQPPDEALQTAN
jgi:hypothetical protein